MSFIQTKESQKNKFIVCINGSRSIETLNLSYFITPEHIETLILGGAKGVDTIASNGADKNNIDKIIFYPEGAIYGKRAGFERNKTMVQICDILISFGDGKSPGTKQALDYAIKIGRPYILHLIQNLD